MNKLHKILSLLILAFVLIISNSVVFASEKNYLNTDDDYFKKPEIKKDYLDLKVKDNISQLQLDKLKESANSGVISFNEDMTFFDFYLANDISIEDEYAGYQKINTINGVEINSNPSKYGPLTYVGPANNKQRIKSTGKVYEVYSPTMFSRLSVGNLEDVDINLSPSSVNSAKFGRYTGIYSPNTLKMDQKGTVMDYMLTKENNIVIPTRYNSVRDDVYLTMRSKTPFSIGLRGIQAYLTFEEVLVDDNGIESLKPVLNQTTNPNFYINTNSKILLTGAGYNNMGFWGRIQYATFANDVNDSLQNLGVEEFVETINKGLRKADQTAGSGQITSGLGAQIQLTGFYRDSNLDNEFLATEKQRQQDALKKVQATYFMYSTGEASYGALNPEIKTIPVEFKDKIPTWDDNNINMMSSPNVSFYSTEISRPMFVNFGDLNTKIDYDTNNFDSLIGLDSFKLKDDGILKDGTAVAIDYSRVRVILNDIAYDFNDLKTELQKTEYEGKELELIYTYAATDADDEIIGKLPKDIANNKGAYAIPFKRNLVIAVKPKVVVEPNVKTENKPFLPKTGTKENYIIIIGFGLIASAYLILKTNKNELE